MKKRMDRHPENFQSFVIEKLIYHADKLSEHSDRLVRLEEKVDKLGGKVDRIEERVSEINERTEFLPKLYDAVDAFMKEIKESRDDRVVLGRKVSNHEKRLIVVEAAAAIKSAENIK